jgi:fibro-slime domain-containing protein
LGWGDSYQASSGASPQNFEFTLVYSGRFTYAGIEFLTFAGSNDVFVYINNLLAIDLGGVHSTETASIDLTYPAEGCSANNTGIPPCSTRDGSTNSTTSCACTLGLSVGGNYQFDLFYAQRHTVASTFSMSKSILVQCPWYDCIYYFH